MKDWREAQFKEYFEIGLRNGLTKPSKVRGSGVRMVNMKEIFGYDFITDETPMELVPVTDSELENSSLICDDLLFARQSLVESGAGKIAIYKGNNPAVFESHLIRCRIDKKKASPDFIYYLFKSPIGRGTVSTIVQQVAAAGIKGSDLQNLEFRFPPLEEQKSIASVLSSLDDKIDLLHRQNKTIEAMAETLFRQWFVEGVGDWEVFKLGDCVTISYGKNLPTKNLLSEGYPVFGANGQIGFYERFTYEEPQVLVSCRGEASGKVNVSLPKSFITNNSLTLERNKRQGISFEFLKYWALSYDFKLHVSGSAQPQITIDGLYDADFPCPDEKLISEFTGVVEPLEKKLYKNSLQVSTLEKLRDNLLPKLMSGEVRVSA